MLKDFHGIVTIKDVYNPVQIIKPGTWVMEVKKKMICTILSQMFLFNARII